MTLDDRDPSPPTLRLAELIERHDGFLVDAYGVLVDHDGALPGAAAAIAAIRAAGKPLVIVTNDTSRSPATIAARFAGMGIAIGAGEIVTPGLLLPGYVAARDLAGGRALVLGTSEAHAYVAAAGLATLSPAAVGDGALDVDAVVVCDDSGFDFLPAMNATLTACLRALDAGRPQARVCTNRDLVYPRGPDAWGFTAGTMTLMLEAALDRRHPGACFDTLGKPAPALFQLGCERLGDVDRVVMIGDQLETDVAGARAAGLSAALVTGVSVWRPGAVPAHRAPHWLLAPFA